MATESKYSYLIEIGMKLKKNNSVTMKYTHNANCTVFKYFSKAFFKS